MDASEIRTPAEVELLTPDERHRLLNERTVTSLTDVSPDFLARARAEGRRLLEDRQVIDADQS